MPQIEGGGSQYKQQGLERTVPAGTQHASRHRACSKQACNKKRVSIRAASCERTAPAGTQRASRHRACSKQACNTIRASIRAARFWEGQRQQPCNHATGLQSCNWTTRHSEHCQGSTSRHHSRSPS
jgi:hypothetical protein